MLIPALIPSLIPPGDESGSTPPLTPGLDPGQLYDIAIGGIGFIYANDQNQPNIWETVAPTKDRVDQAETAGEQTLSSWWFKSQESFQGGAGQPYLEPAFAGKFDHVRYDLSKNVDVSTPGEVTRLPDTVAVSAISTQILVAVVVGGDDALVVVDAGTAKLITDLDGTPSAASFTGTADDFLALVTDGASLYGATSTDVWILDPSNLASAVKLVTYADPSATPVLGWVKSRLMLGVAGAVYELDVSSPGTTLDGTSATGLVYQHPAAGFTWRCFGTSPTAIVAAGDVGARSTITQFTLTASADTAPTLTVTGDVGEMPIGERVLSLLATQGSFLAIGTTKGVRIGTFDTYIGTLNYGPLTLPAIAPVIPAAGLAARDRFIFSAGMAYDEGGLIRIDLGMQFEDGRNAWAPDLIAPTATDTAATAVAAISDGRFAFSIPGTGVLLEQVGPGEAREAWLRTSKIRYGTTEPKLFKFGRLRGDFSDSAARVSAITPTDTFPLIDVGFTLTDPKPFKLPSGQFEWLQLLITLEGVTSKITSYQVQALPGTRKQYHYNLVVDIHDRWTARNGQKQIDVGSSRGRVEAIKEIDQLADETTFQQFTPGGIISAIVVIERFSFTQDARPTQTSRSDVGGTATILLRTVES